MCFSPRLIKAEKPPHRPQEQATGPDGMAPWLIPEPDTMIDYLIPPIIQSVAHMTPKPLLSMTIDFSLYNFYF